MSHLDPRWLDGTDEWRAAWNALRWRDRRRIRGAVDRGAALADARDAALAVGYVRSILLRRTSRLVTVDPTFNEMGEAQLHNAEEHNLAVVRAHVAGAGS